MNIEHWSDIPLESLAPRMHETIILRYAKPLFNLAIFVWRFLEIRNYSIFLIGNDFMECKNCITFVIMRWIHFFSSQNVYIAGQVLFEFREIRDLLSIIINQINLKHRYEQPFLLKRETNEQRFIVFLVEAFKFVGHK